MHSGQALHAAGAEPHGAPARAARAACGGAGYLDGLGLAEGWMAIFDDGKEKSWDEKLYNRDVEFNGKTLHVVGL